MPDKPGIAYQILGPVADANIDVDMIMQNVGARRHHRLHLHRPPQRLQEGAWTSLKATCSRHIGAREVTGDDKIAKVSVVGVGMRSHVGVARKMFETLSKEGINIQMISTSEIKISVVIEEKYMELAVRALHQAFDLDKASA